MPRKDHQLSMGQFNRNTPMKNQENQQVDHPESSAFQDHSQVSMPFKEKGNLAVFAAVCDIVRTYRKPTKAKVAKANGKHNLWVPLGSKLL